MPGDPTRMAQENSPPKVGRMRIWRDRNRGPGLKGITVWTPPEREVEVQALAERWRVEAGKVLASDLPSDDQLRALVRASRAARQPVHADALASRTAAAAYLSEASSTSDADQ